MIFNKTYSLYLKKSKFLPKDVLEKQFEEAESKNEPMYLTMVRNEVANEDKIYENLASFLGIPYKFFQLNELNFDLIRKFPLEKLVLLGCMPYSEDHASFTVASSNPLNFEEIKNLKGIVNKNITIFLVSDSNAKKLVQYVSNKELQNVALSESAEATEKVTTEDNMLDNDAPVIKLCDTILVEAVELGASDIHIEPYDDMVRVRFRINGSLVEHSRVKNELFQAILARFKIMAKMNIAERRVPQDGKISLMANSNRYDFRVSTLPTLFGEKIVIRIYNSAFNSADFSVLGFDERQSKVVLQMITRPHGIVLLTGPTGSGKSTTLYSFLRYLNTPFRNIITVEDPVENQISGINQVQVNNKANMTFSNALRAILRQDPNVIMIGEIRDEETAMIATRAAITGHLVLSTIHTNDAVGVVSRLINMGIPRYLVSDALLGSISQRLVKKLCPYCKKAVETTPSQMVDLGLDKPITIYEPCGCTRCNHTGFTERLGLFEIMVNTPRMKEAIMDENLTGINLERVAEEDGKHTILDEARSKVIDGTISFSEFDRLSDNIEAKLKPANQPAENK